MGRSLATAAVMLGAWLACPIHAARAEAPPRSGGLVYRLSVEAYRFELDWAGGAVNMRGGAIGAAVAMRIVPRLMMGGQVELARPANGRGAPMNAAYLNGFATVRIAGGLLATAELVTSRLNVGHRGDATGLGIGGQLRYELSAGGTTATSAQVGFRWIHTRDDEGSHDIGNATSATVGVGVTWY